LINAQRAHKKAEYQLQYLQEKAFWVEDVINSRNAPTKKILSPFRKTPFYAKAEWYYYRYVRVHLLRFLSIACIPMIIILCYSEFTPLIGKFTSTDVSVISLFLRTMAQFRLLLQVCTDYFILTRIVGSVAHFNWNCNFVVFWNV
jgi:hypothetical protein